MYHFCTLFDRNYLFKGLALHASLQRHCQAFTLHILCMDALTMEVLERLQLPNVRLIALDHFEDEALRQAKTGRTAGEYCWTCTPSLPLYVFEHNPEISLVTYLDADLLFFSDPTPIYDEFGDNSIVIVEHRFVERLKHLVSNGIYNVEWVSFRRDESGMECLRWWRDRCNEWCYNRLEDGKLGDQKYLDDWIERFSGVHVLQHVGAGVAPWNFGNYRITERGGQIYIDDSPLIFYHFHQFRSLKWGKYFWVSDFFKTDKEPPAIIYRAYEKAIASAIQRVQKVFPEFQHGIDPALPVLLRSAARRFFPESLKKFIPQSMRVVLRKVFHI